MKYAPEHSQTAFCGCVKPLTPCKNRSVVGTSDECVVLGRCKECYMSLVAVHNCLVEFRG